MNINSGRARLELLCPAWREYGKARTVKPGTVILHGRADEVVPSAASEEMVRNSGLPAWTLIGVGSDHRPADPEPLATMLEACLVDDQDEAADWEADAILERDWTGPCHTAALRCARGGREEQGWLVVHGTALSEEAGKHIGYSTCERGGRVEQQEVCGVYCSEDVMLLANKNRHGGPWAESEQRKE